MYNRKDHYYKKAKKEGKASRAAYKLLEIQEKYRIWKKGDRVLDLGSAPGGWLQVLSQEVGLKGKIIGIDRLPLHISPPKNVQFIQKSIEEESLLGEIERIHPKFDVILSDLSPNLSGIVFRDTFQSYELGCQVWELAKTFLKKGGNLTFKIFPGEEANRLKTALKKAFQTVITLVPQATRKGSSEVYWIALGFQGQFDTD